MQQVRNVFFHHHQHFTRQKAIYFNAVCFVSLFTANER
jgi:hypothetical protein